jgi:hypothetical protein
VIATSFDWLRCTSTEISNGDCPNRRGFQQSNGRSHADIRLIARGTDAVHPASSEFLTIRRPAIERVATELIGLGGQQSVVLAEAVRLFRIVATS